MPLIAGYVYASREDSVYVNLYVNSTARIELSSNTVKLTQHTDYPWTGDIKLILEPQERSQFALNLRIPGWTTGHAVPSELYRYLDDILIDWGITINGCQVSEVPTKEGYAVLLREWEAGDVVELRLPMPVRRVISHDNVKPNRGRVAIERGPVVYCLEGADHDGKVLDVFLPDDAELRSEFRPNLFGGVSVLVGTGRRVVRDGSGKSTSKSVELTMIPYYSWCHRGANEMQVWLPRTMDGAEMLPTAY